MNTEGDIVDGVKLDIPLRPYKIREARDPVAYFVDARDLDGEYVRVAVFEDGGQDIETGHWYRFVNAKGSIYSSDTPKSIEVQPYTEILPLDGRPDPGDIDGSDSGSESEPESESDSDSGDDPGRRGVDEEVTVASPFEGRPRVEVPGSGALLPELSPLTVAAISGMVTAIAIVGSLFAGDLGPAAAAGIVVVAALLATLSSYFGLKDRYVRARGEYRERLIDVVFDSLATHYRESVPDAPPIRANVMRPRSGRPGDDELRIAYVSTAYGDDELEQTYEPSQGCWGRAYASGEPEWYDEDTHHYADGDLTGRQRRITEDVQSALSVPIRHEENGAVVGVLTVDSPEPVERTRFDDPAMQALVAEYAVALTDVVR